MKKCPECKTITNGVRCRQCGHEFVSVDEATLDQMIQRASVPNLAMMFRRGKEAGYLQPVQTYTAVA